MDLPQRKVLTKLVDGFRIDAAKHVHKPFWTQFQPEVNIYTVGEALDGNATYVCEYMSQALSGVLNYPMSVCS
jgi:alpha-amylase